MPIHTILPRDDNVKSYPIALFWLLVCCLIDFVKALTLHCFCFKAMQSWRTSPSLKMIMNSAVSLVILLFLLCEAHTVVLLNPTDSSLPANNFTDTEAALSTPLESADIPKARRKRYISQNDMIAILDYHNQVRGKVFPPAANMEYMVRGICPFLRKLSFVC